MHSAQTKLIEGLLSIVFDENRDWLGNRIVTCLEEKSIDEAGWTFDEWKITEYSLQPPEILSNHQFFFKSKWQNNVTMTLYVASSNASLAIKSWDFFLFWLQYCKCGRHRIISLRSLIIRHWHKFKWVHLIPQANVIFNVYRSKMLAYILSHATHHI